MEWQWGRGKMVWKRHGQRRGISNRWKYQMDQTRLCVKTDQIVSVSKFRSTWKTDLPLHFTWERHRNWEKLAFSNKKVHAHKRLLKFDYTTAAQQAARTTYSIQIMNVFIRAMVRIFSWGERWNVLFNEAIAELNGTFHLSPHENILTIARIKTFIICFL